MLVGQDRCSQSPGQLWIGCHRDLSPQIFADGIHDGGIPRDAAAHHDFVNQAGMPGLGASPDGDHLMHTSYHIVQRNSVGK